MFKSRLSPALVVAIIALVAVTAGTATAATKILIKNSAQVKNGALEAADLSAKARKSLQGQQGPAGPAGAAGAQGAPGATGARGPSEAFAVRKSGLNTPTCPAGGCDPDATLATMTLPAGSYLLTASAEIAPFTFVAGAEHNVDCRLFRADTGLFQRSLNVYEAPPTNGIVPDESVQLTGAVTLTAPTTLTYTCSVGSVKFTAGNVHLAALQVGTLTETVS